MYETGKTEAKPNAKGLALLVMVSETHRGDSLTFEQLSSQSVCDSHS